MGISSKGVLLVNLGTPNSYRPKDVFHYLNEFLTDERVLDIPWLLRQILVRGWIVPKRFRQSSLLYKKVWTQRGSPLLVHGKDVEQKLQKVLGDKYKVVLAMRYQQPSIPTSLEVLKQAQVEEIIVLPLFPQYASATTGSIHQKVMHSLQTWQNIPNLRLINSFPVLPLMIDAFYERAKQYALSSYDHILFSFHGLPEKQLKKASLTGCCLTKECCQSLDVANQFCYKAQCIATASALAKRLSLTPSDYTICFQSRLGRDPWIQPYTIDIIKGLAEKKHKRLLVFCPAFVCDCLETTCEISHEYGAEFKKWGGEHLQLVEGLNDHPLWIDALHQLIVKS